VAAGAVAPLLTSAPVPAPVPALMPAPVLPLPPRRVPPFVRTLRLAIAGATVLATVIGTNAGAGPRPGVTERMSVTSSGVQGNANSGAGIAPVAITPDGRYVAFSSDASNLVPGDLNQEADVFVHDRRTGKTMMASVPSPGTVATVIAGTGPVLCPARVPAISANGRYVAFTSCRSFDGKPPEAGADVWVHDFATGATTRVSVTYNGAPLLGTAVNPSISNDGRYVAFESTASNLVPARCPEDTVSNTTCTILSTLLGVSRQVYVRDMVRRTTSLVSVGATRSVGDGDAYNPAISGDGHVVAFTSNADNLVTNDHNLCMNETPSCADVYTRDLRTGKTELVSVGVDGQAASVVPGLGDGADIAERGSLSTDGRYVAFYSGQEGLVPADAPITAQGLQGDNGTYVRDRKLGRTERMSVTSAGEQRPLGGGLASIDATGRYVVFDAVEECGTGATTGSWSVAIHDRITGETRLLDRADATGHEIDCPTGYTSASPVVSSGGRYVAFGTDASMLVHGDTNKSFDVFVRDEGIARGVGRIVASAHAAGVGVAAPGWRVMDANVVYRPSLHDLFVRLDVAAMSPVALAPASIRYVVALSSHGQSYQLRMTSIAGIASFGLFRATGTGWLHVGDVSGGYGTTGQQVVAAIPFSALGATSPSDLSDIEVITQLAPATTIDVLALR
jgi:Tol biopolymer transport system component